MGELSSSMSPAFTLPRRRATVVRAVCRRCRLVFAPRSRGVRRIMVAIAAAVPVPILCLERGELRELLAVLFLRRLRGEFFRAPMSSIGVF